MIGPRQPPPGVTREGVSSISDTRNNHSDSFPGVTRERTSPSCDKNRRDFRPSKTSSSLLNEAQLGSINVGKDWRYSDFCVGNIKTTHSSNRRNRNRIRKYIRRMIRSEESLRADARSAERLAFLHDQLEQFQAKPSGINRADEGKARRAKAAGSDARWTASRDDGPRPSSARTGRRLGFPRCIHYPHPPCVVSRRRYGVASEGKKFKSLSRWPGVEIEKLMHSALGRKGETDNPQDSAGSASGEAGVKEVPGGGPSQCKDQKDSAHALAPTPQPISAPGPAPATAPASTPDPTSGPAPVPDSTPASAQDSAPVSAPAPAAASASTPAPAPNSASPMKITVRRGRKKTRTFTVNSSCRVADLQKKIHEWCEVAPADQRLFYDGIPLHPALGLDSLWDGITITMAKGMLGGGGLLSWGEKKKRGRKKSAQRAARKRNAKAAADRFYEETKRMMESRSRPDDEMGYGEFEEYMATEVSHEELEEAAKKEEEYKSEIAKAKVPIYGTLHPTMKADDSVRFMSVNVNCLSMWKRLNYKAKRLRWLLKNYQIDTMGLQEVCVNWRNFRCNLAHTLRSGADPIISMASHNILEAQNMGNT